jgi:predicted ATP-grasp superfamily ATP-dependent carboligase
MSRLQHSLQASRLIDRPEDGHLERVVEREPVSAAAVSQTTVLIGFAEALAAPEVAWSLIDDGFRVVGYTRRRRPSALRHSRHVECHEICAPESDLEKSIADLRALMASLGGDAERVLFPLDDTALWLSGQMEDDPCWRVAGPGSGSTDMALDKQLQTRLAREAGFHVPRTHVVCTANELLRLSGEPFPLILKPVDCVPVTQGRVRKCGIWICADSRELDRACAEWAERVPLLVQPFLSGTGEGVFGFATGRGIYAWSAHQRLRMMNPQGSGSSACVSQRVDPEIRARTQELVRSCRWRGLFMIELLRDLSGKPWFIELNGRPWGSMALSRRQGLDYPAWQARLALGQEPVAEAEPACTPGLVCRHAGRELMHLLFVLRGPRSRALDNWPSFWKAMGNVLKIHRGDAFYNWRRGDAKVFIADFFYTLRENLMKSGR